jgi:hypothetical protein
LTVRNFVQPGRIRALPKTSTAGSGLIAASFAKGRQAPAMTVDSAPASVSSARDPVIWAARSERLQWRACDFRPISVSATGIEVFSLTARKAKGFQWATNNAPKGTSE